MSALRTRRASVTLREGASHSANVAHSLFDSTREILVSDSIPVEQIDAVLVAMPGSYWFHLTIGGWAHSANFVPGDDYAALHAKYPQLPTLANWK